MVNKKVSVHAYIGPTTITPGCHKDDQILLYCVYGNIISCYKTQYFWYVLVSALAAKAVSIGHQFGDVISPHHGGKLNGSHHE